MIDILSYKLGQKSGSGGGGSNEDWIGDGNTHLWITLQEGRTSPMLGVGVNGTVTVNWGDGSTPDVLTGTSTSTAKWTPNHNYAAAGDYVITLTVDGEMGFGGDNAENRFAWILRYSSYSDERNNIYQNTLRKVEIGDGVTSIGAMAFQQCYNLRSVTIHAGVISIGTSAFTDCYSLTDINMPNSLIDIGMSAFSKCYSLTNINIPNSVISIGTKVFNECHNLASVVIPNGITTIPAYAFYACYSLASIDIPSSITSIGDYSFRGCSTLASVVIPNSVTSIGSNAFYYSRGLAFLDFTQHTSVPALSNTNAFGGTASDFKIYVPTALVDEWKAATNWSSYASRIVGV